MKREIRITCESAARMNYKDMSILQGNLKDLSSDNYRRMKTQFLNLGFADPISIWQNKGKNWILNGTQRVRTVSRMAEEEGYTIPKLPISLIVAKDLNEAIQVILSLASQFGEMNKEGLYELMSLSKLNSNDLVANFRFPEIDLEDFKLEFFSDIDSEEMQKKAKKHVTCPKCKYEF